MNHGTGVVNPNRAKVTIRKLPAANKAVNHWRGITGLAWKEIGPRRTISRITQTMQRCHDSFDQESELTLIDMLAIANYVLDV